MKKLGQLSASSQEVERVFIFCFVLLLCPFDQNACRVSHSFTFCDLLHFPCRYLFCHHLRGLVRTFPVQVLQMNRVAYYLLGDSASSAGCKHITRITKNIYLFFITHITYHITVQTYFGTSCTVVSQMQCCLFERTTLLGTVAYDHMQTFFVCSCYHAQE